MGHEVKLFAGSGVALRAFVHASQHARMFALRSPANLFVVPLGDDLQDDLHRLHGTGDWLETGPRISTGDMAFAARASRAAPVAYVETAYFGGVGSQSGALWTAGALALGPLTMSSDSPATRGRARSLWPINVVLRGLGIRAEGYADEFEAFGLGLYRSHEAIAGQALAIEV